MQSVTRLHGDLSRWPRLRNKRLLEVAVIAFVSTGFVVLPSFFNCEPATIQQTLGPNNACMQEQWRRQFFSGWSPDGKNIPSPMTFGAQYNPALCPVATNLTSSCAIKKQIAPFINKTVRKWEQQAQFYCCGFNSIEELQAGCYG